MFHKAVYNRWNGLVDWSSGLDYWTRQLHLKRPGTITIHG